jgi:hypothetical protein
VHVGRLRIEAVGEDVDTTTSALLEAPANLAFEE